MIKKEQLTIDEKDVYETLKEVIDPELIVNIIDLGLIYEINVSENPVTIDLELTLTSKGCPMGDVIIQDIEQSLYRQYPGVVVNIELVWEPAWNMDMVTEDGHVALRVG